MVEAKATARYVRTSAQKAGLVLDLIRGKDVNQALATLRFTRKGIAEDVAKVLRSAIANAQNKDGFSGDVDRLFVLACSSAPRISRSTSRSVRRKSWRLRPTKLRRQGGGRGRARRPPPSAPPAR